MINRKYHLQHILHLLKEYPIVGLIGPRQVGKTTLAKAIVKSLKQPTTFFDLEDPRDVARLTDPMLTLSPLKGLVILDEVQRRPELFPVLRVLVDNSSSCRFLVLGSASPQLLNQTSESLAGRIAFHVINGFILEEIGNKNLNKLWERGGFPRSFTAKTIKSSYLWRENFIQTFLERDLAQYITNTSPFMMQRFWSMLAHYHAQVWNGSEFARSFGISEHMVRRYLDGLTGTFMVRQLAAWHQNINKRQIKAPKIYISDSGMLHALLGLTTMQSIQRHPKLGASWEGFCLEMIISHLRAPMKNCFFWATHAQAELDLLIIQDGIRRGFEFKYTSTPYITPSMRHALVDLKLDSLDVIHGGAETFYLSDKIRAVSVYRLQRDINR